MDHYASVNQINLHYLEYQGGAPTIVLLHGLTANAHSFDGLMGAGLTPRFHVVAPDLRGRGLSDKPATGYAIADHAADVIGLLDALGLEQVVLGGHSYGGLLSIYIAGHFPARVSKLVVIDAALSALRPEVREQLKPSLERLGKTLPSLEVYLQAMQRAPFLDGYWDAALENYFRADAQSNPDGTAHARTRPEIIAEVIDRAIVEPWTEHLARVHQPTLLLNAPGAYGPPGAPPILARAQALETVEMLQHNGTACQYLELPGNHVTMLFGANAPRVVEAITEFAANG